MKNGRKIHSQQEENLVPKKTIVCASPLFIGPVLEVDGPVLEVDRRSRSEFVASVQKASERSKTYQISLF